MPPTGMYSVSASDSAPSETVKPRMLSLFAGYGGLSLAVEEHFNAELVAYSEFDPAPSKVMAAHWPGVPNLGDITKVDWQTISREFGPIHIIDGGFPCQDVSLAGGRRGLMAGTRSGLWHEFVKAIEVLEPKYVVVENVRGLLSADGEPWPADLIALDEEVKRLSRTLKVVRDRRRRYEGNPAYVERKNREEHRLSRLHKRALARFKHEHRFVQRAIATVLRELARLGFDAEWRGLRAADVGAPHGRFRVFVLATRRENV